MAKLVKWEGACSGWVLVRLGVWACLCPTWLLEIAPFGIRCTASKFFRERAKLGALIMPCLGSRLRARVEPYSMHVTDVMSLVDLHCALSALWKSLHSWNEGLARAGV